MSEKFQIFISDCPFEFADRLKMSSVKRGAEAHYSTLSTNDLKSLPVKDIVDEKGALLCFWCPAALLKEGIEITESWGFPYLKQVYTWVKVRKNSTGRELAMGMGRLFRGSSELCLVCTNGTTIYKKLQNRSQRNVCFAENTKHSMKPLDLHKSLNLMFPDKEIKKIELFSRQSEYDDTIKADWLLLGNEAKHSNGEDIRTSLAKLIDYKI